MRRIWARTGRLYDLAAAAATNRLATMSDDDLDSEIARLQATIAPEGIATVDAEALAAVEAARLDGH